MIRAGMSCRVRNGESFGGGNYNLSTPFAKGFQGMLGDRKRMMLRIVSVGVKNYPRYQNSDNLIPSMSFYQKSNNLIL